MALIQVGGSIVVKLSIANFITIGLIAVAFNIGLKYGLGAAGINPSWL